MVVYNLDGTAATMGGNAIGCLAKYALSLIHIFTICSMENFDPVGVHTGDSIVIAPAVTLADKAVSYTHLDVYKRQPERSDEAARALPAAPDHDVTAVSYTHLNRPPATSTIRYSRSLKSVMLEWNLPISR